MIEATLTRNNFGRMARTVAEIITDEIDATAAAVLAEGKRRVHVLSGATRASGRIERQGPYAADVIFGEGAVFEEYGTRYRPPHPFLTPAMEAQRAPYFDRLQRALEAGD